MKIKLAIAVIAAILVLIPAVLWASSVLSAMGPAAIAQEPVTIGVPMMLDSSALIYIAQDQGYFKDNGLNVTLNVYDAGLYAVGDMLEGKNDIAVATEFVMAGKVLEGKNITSVAGISRYDIHYLVARHDRGIESIRDLKGKKIGFARGTSGEFFLCRYLALNGVNITDITPVDVQPSHYADAISNGSVDAVLAWDPQIDTIKEMLGDNAIVWPAQSGRMGYWNAICREDWTAQHPELISRFLKSLAGAEDYMVRHPAEAKAIIKKKTGYNDTYIATTWRNTQFSLSLDESLITAMEDEGRWMISSNLTGVKKIPDFRDNFYLEGLRAIKPESVNIIS